eukprot:TRINITY_DN4397_c0_g1_i6.p1 TRINITY_DN4397_c0_g1~~TRINITY_DN4397_c0_g1_i6.p1  ORF type:complete len:267 (-),score=66.83 TRINITY_DN4397_c0_g1_i6:230-946(-)
MLRSLVGSEMCIRDRYQRRVRGPWSLLGMEIEVLPGPAGRTRFRTVTGHSEMVEDYDQIVQQLYCRKTRSISGLGKHGAWTVEIGDPEMDAVADSNGGLMFKASSNNPIFARYDTPRAFEWRVRNLSWPAEVYSVEVDPEAQQIVIRTSNKKYFKRFGVPELLEIGLELEPESISHSFNMNTLVIHYEKPVEVLNLLATRREKYLEALAGVPQAEPGAAALMGGPAPEGGDPNNCKQQ